MSRSFGLPRFLDMGMIPIWIAIIISAATSFSCASCGLRPSRARNLPNWHGVSRRRRSSPAPVQSLLGQESRSRRLKGHGVVFLYGRTMNCRISQFVPVPQLVLV
jgi:hypothetical protein